MCILSVYIAKVVDYDLSVLSMSVMGLKKNVWMGGRALSNFDLDFLNFFNFAKPLS